MEFDPESYKEAKPILWLIVTTLFGMNASLSSAKGMADDLLEEFEKRYITETKKKKKKEK
jgi:hypothetical protein